MSVLHKLKWVAALLLALCLFLPLSQCSVKSTLESASPSVTQSDKRIESAQRPSMSATPARLGQNQYVFNDPRDPLSWGGALVLLAPLGVLWLTRREPHGARPQLALLVLGCLAFYVIFRATFWADRILPGGYLAYAGAVVLIYLATLELWLKARWFQPR